jgi:hypothetical protein
VAFLLIATLLSVALIAFGAVALLFPRPAPARSPAGEDLARPSLPGKEASGRGSVPTTPVARLKAVVRARDWRRALPSLLVIAGLLGVMLFGSLAMVFVFGHTGAGVASLAVTVFAIVKLAIDYGRA